jgi:endonuclease YncB( thermonuclease family)
MRWPGWLLLLMLPAAGAETLSGTVVTVIDGDTLTVADAAKKHHRVRLLGVDAPEVKQAFGVRSARSLAQLCFRKQASVEWQDKERSLLLAQVTCEGKEANAEQVRRGLAWVSPKQLAPGSPLYELEAYARLRKLGLWADEGAQPPWEWRARR